jgi:hypothetical protein
MSIIEEDVVNPVGSLQEALTVLHSPTSELDMKMAGLRYLNKYLSDGKGEVDTRMRANINQVVLDTVLKIVLSEDRITDLRRRQLMRTECFLILGSLLGSNTLFGGLHGKLDQIEDNNEKMREEWENRTEEVVEKSIELSDLEIDAMMMADMAGGSSAKDETKEGQAFGAAGAGTESISGPMTPSKKRRGVQLKNPIHSGKKAGRSDGFKETKSPDVSATKNKKQQYQHMSPAATKGPPGTRPPMGPPGGWVRDSPNNNSKTSPGGEKSLLRVGSPTQSERPPSPAPTTLFNDDVAAMAGSSLTVGRAEQLSVDLAYSKSTGDLNLMTQTLSRPPRKMKLPKSLKARPSVFLGSEYETDNFAPGVSGTDWFEQDRRLGYQKPRMWFPLAPGGELEGPIVPRERSGHNKGIKPDDVVKEFLQMKALMSYVSDMIMIPYSNETKKLTRTNYGKQKLDREGVSVEFKPFRRLAGVLGHDRFDQAMEEAMELWSPLVGAHLPGWAKKKVYETAISKSQQGLTLLDISKTNSDPHSQYASSRALGDVYGETPMARKPWEPLPEKEAPKTGLNLISSPSRSKVGANLEKKVLFTKEVLRSLVTEGKRKRERTKATFQETMNQLNNSAGLSKRRGESMQLQITTALNEEQENVQAEMEAMNELMRRTVDVQYATLPDRFRLLLEGGKAEPRQLTKRMMYLYCRTKSRNWTALAFGIWKAHMTLAKSKELYPLYARRAACHLMKEWAISRKARQMRRQIATWRNNVARMIFVQRNTSVLPFQTLYRKYRDRCLIMRLHVQGFYKGPLSDIELGEWRENVKFRIPRAIRETRRDIWFGLVRVQTVYRKWIVYRHTLKRRRQVVLLQSVIRMFPKREKFKRLRRHTIRMQAYARRIMQYRRYAYMKIKCLIMQKYVRRYLKTIWKWRVFEKAWSITEKRMGAAVLIQCRWREYACRQRIARIIKYRKDREWGALVLQRRWFKKKNAFHTFVLMCCLRAAEKEDGAFNKYVKSLGRYYAARVVQREYAIRFFKRNIAAVIKIQCKYRGYHGYNLMERLRREKWASRRLHHWARGALRRRDRRVRLIQRTWWKYKRGALLRHFFHHARQEDAALDKSMARERNAAACIIQAYALGKLARTWVVTSKAARVIQRNAKFFIARMGWKRMTMMRNKAVIKHYVDTITNSMVSRRVQRIIAKHSKLAEKPQALVRRFLLRCKWLRSLEAATTYAKAVLTIQRAYRASGAMAAAVAEVMAKKREADNPFRQCSTIHRLLQLVYTKTETLFSVKDPRVGMTMSSFMYRLGLSYLTEMFPKHEFGTFADIKGANLTISALEEMWGEFQEKEIRRAKQAGARKAEAAPPPYAHFRALLRAIHPKLVPTGPSEKMDAQKLLVYAESDFDTPLSCAKGIETRFIKRYGLSQTNRGVNLGSKVATLSWFGYCNFRMLGAVVTPAMVDRVLEDCDTGPEVAPMLDQLTKSYTHLMADADLKWDRKRVSLCADTFQLAAEGMLSKMLETLDEEKPDPIYLMLESTMTKVRNYQKRFKNNKARLLKEGKVGPVDRQKHTYNGVEFKWSVEEGSENTLSAIDSVDLPFNGSKRDFDMEHDISICKLYMDLFDRLHTISGGIQGLKNKWFVYTVKRALRNFRIQKKLDVVMQEYMAEKNDNHVQKHWLHFKRIDAVTRKFRERAAELEEKRLLITDVLQHVLQYGWEERTDDQGYAYYEDVAERGFAPTYDPPRYEFSQWKAIAGLQKHTRKVLEAAREKARLKEEARLAEMARIEALWMEEIRKGKKGAKLSLSLKPVDIAGMLSKSIAVAAAKEKAAAEKAAAIKAAKDAAKAPGGGGVGKDKDKKNVPDAKSPNRNEGGEVDKTVDPSLFAEGSADVGESVVRDKKGTAPADKKSGTAFGGKEEPEKEDEPHILTEEEAHLEGHIPWKLRFEKNTVWVPGMWALLRTKLKDGDKKVRKLNPEWKHKPKPVTPSSANSPSRGSTGRRSSSVGLKDSTMGTRGTGDGDEPPPGSRKSAKKKGAGYGRYGKEHIQAQRAEEAKRAESAYREKLRKSNPYLVESQGFSYEPVVIYKFRKIDEKKGSGSENLLCDTRTFRGVRTNGVKTNRIFVMNLDVGSRVECRYKKHTAFYGGRITAFRESQDMRNKEYTVCYDDGEMEKKMTRDYMRPPAEEMQRWFFDRDKAMKQSRMYSLRLAHFYKMRSERMDGIKERAWYTYQGILESMPKGMDVAAFEPLSDDEEDFRDMPGSPSSAATEYFGGDRDMSKASAKEKNIKSGRNTPGSAVNRTGSAALLARGRTSTARSTKTPGTAVVVSPEDEETERERKAFYRRFDYMMQRDNWLQKHADEAKIHLKFTRLPFQYGWSEERLEKMKKRAKKSDPVEYETVVFFKNKVKGETSDSPPNYRPEHDFAARKLQKNWAIRRARKYLRRLLASEPLEEIVQGAIDRYQKFAYVGYKDEGVTTLMLVRRYGFPLVSETIEDALKYRRDELEALTLEGLVNTPPDLLERLGFSGMEHVKFFKEFAAWYKKTSPLMRNKAAKFINYFKDLDDTRPLREVVASGYDTIFEQFCVKFPKSVTRSAAVVQSVVDASYYPHTQGMVDNYLKRYEKAEQARENKLELTNKKTTSNWKEEKEAFTVLWGATRRLHSLISNLGLGSIRRSIIAAEEQAQHVLASLEILEQTQMSHGTKPESRAAKGGEKKKRLLCTGPEARAALVLRVRVFDYLNQVFKAVRLIQRRIRGFNKFSSVNRELASRRKGIQIIQRVMRGCMDRIVATDLREQQAAEWEQLWDGSRQLVYYYNRSTGKSTYLEPAEAYRPLVRDRLSQRLVQAWPSLDAERGMGEKTAEAAAIPQGATEVRPELSICVMCNVRKCVRLCRDCTPPAMSQTLNSMTLTRNPVVPYCFPCFIIAHSSDNTENHQYDDASDALKKDGVLMCASCAQVPATRKCLGIFDDRKIDDICTQLQKSVPRKWPDILKNAGVGGERKLNILLEQISGSSTTMDGSDSSSLSITQLQQVRVLLERTRAECDECYCDECYVGVHSAGKRSSHKWIGFQENAQVCGVCTRSPAEIVCKDCDDHGYCNQCFKVFHSMGRKRKHRNTPLFEQAEFGQDMCGVCTRRVSTYVCPNIIRGGDEPRCNLRLCNSCHACNHAPICDIIAEDLAEKVAYRQAKSDGTAVNPNVAEEGAEICCVCGEDADTQCHECGDMYCSRTWMGNPGCWATHHSKGNRASHTTVRIDDIKSLSTASSIPKGGYAAWA